MTASQTETIYVVKQNPYCAPSTYKTNLLYFCKWSQACLIHPNCSKIVGNQISNTHFHCSLNWIKMTKTSIPKLINSNDFKMARKSIKITKEETLGSSISMNHNKSGRTFFTVEGDCVYKSWFVALWTEPPNFRPWWARSYIDLFYCTWSPDVQFIHIKKLCQQLPSLIEHKVDNRTK